MPATPAVVERFAVIYGLLTDNITYGYKASYLISTPNMPYQSNINLFFWDDSNAFQTFTDLSGTFEISEGTNPNLFWQGISCKWSIAYYEDFNLSVQSYDIYGVFQRRTDDGNCLVMTPKYFTQINDVGIAGSYYKSIILPPTRERAVKYMFKNRNTQPIAICGNMCNITYPLTSNIFTSTISLNKIFLNKFNNGLASNYGSIYLDSKTPLNLCLELITYADLSWNTSRLYTPNCNITLTYGQPNNPKTDSNNSRMLFYEMTPTNSNNDILMSQAPRGTQKDVFIRNITGNSQTIRLFGPSNAAIDDVSGITQYPLLFYTIPNFEFVTFSFFYQTTPSATNMYLTNYYAGNGLSYFDGSGGSFPTINATLSSPIIFATPRIPQSNITLPSAYSDSKYVTYYDVYDPYHFQNITVPSDTRGNYFAVGSNIDARWITTSSSFMRFAVLYKDSSDSNVFLPLGGIQP